MRRGFAPYIACTLGFALVCALAGCKKTAGAFCSKPREAECVSPTSAMVCLGKTWREIGCRGPKGCTTEGTDLDCDESFAVANDACENEGSFACAVDQHATLRCDKERWTVAHACPKSCSVKDRVVDCD